MISPWLNVLFVGLALGAPVMAMGLISDQSDPRDRVGADVETVMPSDDMVPAVEGRLGAEALMHHASSGTPFRYDGQAPPHRYGESPPILSAPPPAVERPKLTVSGIVWGAEPMAIVEGLPGRDQPVLLAQGASEGGFRVTRIERERVTINGMDTTWVLRVRVAW